MSEDTQSVPAGQHLGPAMATLLLMLNPTHFSPSSAGGVLASAMISSPASWPFPLGMAFASAGAVSTALAVLFSFMLALVPGWVCNNQSVLMCVCGCSLCQCSPLWLKPLLSSWDLLKKRYCRISTFYTVAWKCYGHSDFVFIILRCFLMYFIMY